MICKRQVPACRNQWSGKLKIVMSYNPKGGEELKLFTVFGENGLGISIS